MVDVEKLKQLLITPTEDGTSEKIDIHLFTPIMILGRKGNQLEVSALFGSVKCFKYLMISGEEANENICKYAIAGGNIEIIHICEQNGLQFDNCLDVSSFYHRYELFE